MTALDTASPPGAPTAGESGLLRRARVEADAALAAAGVTVSSLGTAGETHRGADLFATIWQTRAMDAPLSAHLLRALQFTGGYVVGGYDGADLVAASAAFFSEGSPLELHSHITGVLPRTQGRGLGFALKLHQRAWALERGVCSITWTFDPLVRRNAAFNLRKLGARVEHYLPAFYGVMDDGINAGDEGDRLFLRWDLTARAGGGLQREEPTLVLAADEQERPIEHADGGSSVLGVGLPRDIEALRATAPAIAASWRSAVRSVLGGALADGWQVCGVGPTGAYLLERAKR